MYGLLDYRGTQLPTTKGYAGLLKLARQIEGERVLFARRAYPDELTLHFGDPVETPGPKGRVILRGTYVLGSVASDWSFKLARLGVLVESGDAAPPLDGDPVPVKPIPDEKLDELLAGVGGTTVALVAVSSHPLGYALSVTMSDGSVLDIRPTPPEDTLETAGSEATPVPDWELFTPYDRYLRVGPERTWAYLPSNEPEFAQQMPAL